MFTVYILYSPSFNKTYTGFTSDLSARVASDNRLSEKGWTIRYRPWSVIHTKEFVTKAEAMQRERYLKTGAGRLFIQRLLKS